jgi:hypothetical protein
MRSRNGFDFRNRFSSKVLVRISEINLKYLFLWVLFVAIAGTPLRAFVVGDYVTPRYTWLDHYAEEAIVLNVWPSGNLSLDYSGDGQSEQSLSPANLFYGPSQGPTVSIQYIQVDTDSWDSAYSGIYSYVWYGYSAQSGQMDWYEYWVEDAGSSAYVGRANYDGSRWYLWDANDNALDYQNNDAADPLTETSDWAYGTIVTIPSGEETTDPNDGNGTGSFGDGNQTYDSDDDVPTLLQIDATLGTIYQRLGELDGDDDDANLLAILAELQKMNEPNATASVPYEGTELALIQDGIQAQASAGVVGDGINLGSLNSNTLPSSTVSISSPQGGSTDVTIDLGHSRFEHVISVGRAGLSLLVVFFTFTFTYDRATSMLAS